MDRRRVVMASVVLGLPAVVCIASPAEAAAPNCSYVFCEGKDPEATRCAQGSRTVAPAVSIKNSSGTVVATVELRWSPTCRTNWTRVTAKNASRRTLTAKVVTSTGGSQKSATRVASQLWSPMVYAPNVCARGSGWVTWSNEATAGGRTQQACG